MRRLALLATILLGACASEGVVGSLAGDGGTNPPGDADASVAAEASGDPAQLERSSVAVGAGGASTCVRTKDARVLCWGENRSGSLGIGDVEPPASSAPVSPANVDRVAAIASGQYQQCALRTDGRILCWGDMFFGDFNGQAFDHAPVVTPFIQDGYGDVARLAVGRFYVCGLSRGGDLACSGLNDEGQLGTGSQEKKYLPTKVSGLDGAVTSVSASMGGVTTCATTSAGSAYCWGRSDRGQAGPGGSPALSPRKIAGLPAAAVEVVIGASHACARLATGDVRCWGANDAGQLGVGTREPSASPVAPKYLSDIVALAAGASHTCALHRTGTVLCWGANAAGQVGDSPDSSVPMMVLSEVFGARAVSCGMAHTCVRSDAGRIRCWGSNAESQLGPKDGTF